MSPVSLLTAPPALRAGAAAGKAAAQLARSFAEMLQSVGRQGRGTEPGGATTAALQQTTDHRGDLERRLQTLLSAFRAHLQQLFGEHELDAGNSLQLRSDECGGICVEGTHPQARQIEALIATQPELGALFAAIQQNATRLREGSGDGQLFQLRVTREQVEPEFVGDAGF